MRFALSLTAASLSVTMLCGVADAQTAVPVGPFRGVELRGGGYVTLRHGAQQRVLLISGSTRFTHFHIKDGNVLAIDACNKECPHHYDLQIEIVTPRIDSVAIEGGGRIVSETGFGKTDELASAIEGGREIDIRSISSETASAAVNGGGLIRLTADRRLQAAVDGGGDIRYRGNPQVASAIDGGGSVNKDR